MKHALLLALIAIAAAGCAGRSYTLTQPDGTRIDMKSNTVLVWGKLNGLDATVKGVKVGSAESQTETEKLGPLVEYMAAGFARGLKASNGAPP